MVGFADVLDQRQSEAIKAYLLDEANQDWELAQQPSWLPTLKQCFYELLAWFAGRLQSIKQACHKDFTHLIFANIIDILLP